MSRSTTWVRVGVPVAFGYGLLGEDGQGDGVGGRGVVAELQVEAGFRGAGEREGATDEALGDSDGDGEVGVGRDGVDQVETGAGDGAGLSDVRGAVQVLEGGEADERGEGEPVAGGAVRGYGAEA